MAVSKNGKLGFTGKVGDTVVYPLNGQWVQRTIGKSNKPATALQLACRQRTKICNDFLNPVLEYIDVGFKAKADALRKNSHNLATSYNRLNAIVGEYPDQHMDFSKVRFSEGKMPVTAGIYATLKDYGVAFSWQVDEDSPGIRWNDQVMLMAYLPEEKDAIYQINGLRRNEGSDILRIPRYEEPLILETYISFISATHKMVSNSVYTGQFLWAGI